MNLSLIKPNWPAPSCIKTFTSLRYPGNSVGTYAGLNLALHVEDDEACVKKNREDLIQSAHLPNEPKWLNQVHSSIAVPAETIHLQAPVTADASYTTQKNTVCVVMTADCLPILITHKTGTEIAAIHAGWVGLAHGVVENTFAALKSHPEDLLVWIGPSISQPFYEVGEDFYQAFAKNHTPTECEAAFASKNNKKWLADVPLLAKQRLMRLGVPSEQIYLSHECTYANPERYFSYRRDGKNSGRMGSFIWID